VAEKYGIDKIPAIAILRGGDEPKDYGIRFYGIPSGYEFTSLIEDIMMVSSGQFRPCRGEPGPGGGTDRATSHPGVCYPYLTVLPPGRAPGSSTGFGERLDSSGYG